MPTGTPDYHAKDVIGQNEDVLTTNRDKSSKI